MERRERVIDLREYFVSLKRHMIVLLLVSVICAVALGAYDYRKQASEAGSDISTINEIIAQNKNAYYSSTTGSNSQSKYTDADAPAGAYNAYARLYIDFDYSDVEGYESMDFNSLNDRFEKDACMLVWNSDLLDSVIKDLKLDSYDDMKNITRDDLMWMVNRNFQGAHVMNIVVTDVDPDRAYKICSEIIDKVPETLKTYMNVNEVRALDKPSKVAAKQDSVSANNISSKHVLKYALVGFAAGLILMLIIYLILFIAQDMVHSAMDIEFAGFEMFGGVFRKKSTEKNGRVIAGCLENRNDVNHIILCDIDGKNDVNALGESINEFLKSSGSAKQIITVRDAMHFSDSFEKLGKADAILFTASYDRTSMSDMEAVYRLFKETDIKKLGVALIK